MYQTETYQIDTIILFKTSLSFNTLYYYIQHPVRSDSSSSQNMDLGGPWDLYMEYVGSKLFS